MNRVERKEAITVSEAICAFLRQSRLASGLNTRLVYKAWDEASGAGKYTLKRYFRNGVLYITTSSSVVCSQLEFQKAALVEKMNAILSSDELFMGAGGSPDYIKELRLK